MLWPPRPTTWPVLRETGTLGAVRVQDAQSTSKQMAACIQELHERKRPFPVLIGGAAINRNFG